MRLDQQTLSFIATTGPAEAHDDRISGAFRFRTAREQGIARRQKREIIKTRTAQARRPRSLHHQKFARAAAAMACPLGIQRLDDHHFGGAAGLFRQALALHLGELRRSVCASVSSAAWRGPAAPFVTQLSKRTGAILSQSPRPDPATGSNGCWRTAAPYASIGTNAATGRPCRVMIVEHPFSAEQRRTAPSMAATGTISADDQRVGKQGVGNAARPTWNRCGYTDVTGMIQKTPAVEAFFRLDVFNPARGSSSTISFDGATALAAHRHGNAAHVLH